MKLTKTQITQAYRSARQLRRQKLTYREVANMMNELGFRTKYGKRFTTPGAYNFMNTVKYTSHLRNG